MLDSEVVFGIVHSSRTGKQINPGFTLQGVEDLAAYLEENECDIYSVTCDLAIAPKLLQDLVARIKHLESKLGSQNS